MSPGILEILLVLFLILLVFGANRLPTIAENMAKGIKTFKKGLTEEPTSEKKPAKAPAKKSSAKKSAPKKKSSSKKKKK